MAGFGLLLFGFDFDFGYYGIAPGVLLGDCPTLVCGNWLVLYLGICFEVWLAVFWGTCFGCFVGVVLLALWFDLEFVVGCVCGFLGLGVWVV